MYKTSFHLNRFLFAGTLSRHNTRSILTPRKHCRIMDSVWSLKNKFNFPKTNHTAFIASVESKMIFSLFHFPSGRFYCIQSNRRVCTHTKTRVPEFLRNSKTILFLLSGFLFLRIRRMQNHTFGGYTAVALCLHAGTDSSMANIIWHRVVGGWQT